MQKYAEYQKKQNSGTGIPHLRGAAPGIYTPDGGFIPWEKCVCTASSANHVPRGKILCGWTRISGAGELPDGADLVIPEGITEIGTAAFSGQPIRSAVLPDSLVSAEKDAFYMSNLRSVSFGRGTESVGESAFRSTFLTAVMFPPHLSAVGGEAFANCRDLVYICSGRKFRILFGADVFDGCQNLVSAFFASASSVPADPARVFGSCPLLREISFSGGRMPVSFSDTPPYLKARTLRRQPAVQTAECAARRERKSG